MSDLDEQLRRPGRSRWPGDAWRPGPAGGRPMSQAAPAERDHDLDIAPRRPASPAPPPACLLAGEPDDRPAQRALVLAAVSTVLLNPDSRPARPSIPPTPRCRARWRWPAAARPRCHRRRVNSSAAAAAKANGAGRATTLLITDASYANTRRAGRDPGRPGDRRQRLRPRRAGPGVKPERAAPRALPRAGVLAARRQGRGQRVHRRQRRCTGPSGAIGCYPAGDGSTLVSYPNAAGTTTVLGSGEFMTNRAPGRGRQRRARHEPAGLGQGRDLAGGAGDAAGGRTAGRGRSVLYELMPAGIPWAVLMSVIAVLLVALWRGRRLGPGRDRAAARRRAGRRDRRGPRHGSTGRAGPATGRPRAPRAGPIDRLTPRLGLPAPRPARRRLVTAIAVRTGQDRRRTSGAALYGPTPADDAGLVRLAA